MSDNTYFGKNNSHMTVPKDKLKCSDCLEEKPINEIKSKGYEYFCKECVAKTNGENE